MARIAQTPEEQKKTGLLIIVIAAVALIVGIGQAVSYVNAKTKCTSYVSGTVTDVDSKRVRTRRRRGSRSHTEYRAHIRIDELSPIGTYTLTTRWTRTQYQKGANVRVYYDPRKPSRYYAEGAMPHNGGGYITTGILFLFVGIYSVKKGADGLKIEIQSQDW